MDRLRMQLLFFFLLMLIRNTITVICLMAQYANDRKIGYFCVTLKTDVI